MEVGDYNFVLGRAHCPFCGERIWLTRSKIVVYNKDEETGVPTEQKVVPIHDVCFDEMTQYGS